MRLWDFYPWWKDGDAPSSFTGKKSKILDKINRFIYRIQFILPTDLRRVRKTTILYQIIDQLFLRSGTKPYRISAD